MCCHNTLFAACMCQAVCNRHCTRDIAVSWPGMLDQSKQGSQPAATRITTLCQLDRPRLQPPGSAPMQTVASYMPCCPQHTGHVMEAYLFPPWASFLCTSKLLNQGKMMRRMYARHGLPSTCATQQMLKRKVVLCFAMRCCAILYRVLPCQSAGMPNVAFSMPT